MFLSDAGEHALPVDQADAERDFLLGI